MSFKHVRTAGDLVRFGAALKVDCGNCGASRTLSGPEAVQALGLGPLTRATARLKCARCGMKSARLAVLPRFERQISHVCWSAVQRFGINWKSGGVISPQRAAIIATEALLPPLRPTGSRSRASSQIAKCQPMPDEALLKEAEQCRQRALGYLGRPEASFLLRLAREFDRLARVGAGPEATSSACCWPNEAPAAPESEAGAQQRS